MSAKNEITKRLLSMSGKYSAYEIFTDWIRSCALAVANASTLIRDKVWRDREQLYLDTVRRYTAEEQESFAEMYVWLGDALTQEMGDVLGEVYMEAEMGSKTAGQFFTPFHVSELCARLNLAGREPDPDGKYRIHEPSCGGGGMVIAACKVLRDKGVDYQRKVDVVAQDLDWKGVYMTYLQLSLLGISAIVVQGDTLSEPYIKGKTSKERILVTPMKAGLLALYREFSQQKSWFSQGLSQGGRRWMI